MSKSTSVYRYVTLYRTQRLSEYSKLSTSLSSGKAPGKVAVLGSGPDLPLQDLIDLSRKDGVLISLET